VTRWHVISQNISKNDNNEVLCFGVLLHISDSAIRGQWRRSERSTTKSSCGVAITGVWFL